MKTRVAVVYGGRSGEHEVSLRSAEAVIKHLEGERYEVVRYFISKDGKWSPSPIVPEPGGNPGIDAVFPVLHGTFGEDGTVQGLLELADLPYVGPGVLASSAAMDKEVMKRLCAQSAVPTVEYVVTHRGERVSATGIPFGFPMFVKPANLGSSVGISKVRDQAALDTAISEAAQYDVKVIVERGIEGREFECSVLGNEDPIASAPCEIFPSREFYDYEDKYLLNKAVIELPADLTPEQTDELRRIAIAAYRALGCEGMSRVDFLMERATGKLYMNEVNTIPGFTSISMYPKMWEHSGIGFTALVSRLVDLAIARHERNRATRFTR